MATAVQIELIVDEKGAVQGIRSFDTSLRGTTGSVQSLNRELSVTEKSMARIAQANQAGQQRSRAYWAEQEAGAKRAAAGMDELGKHTLTSLDNVRLLRDDLGIRIPRSMEKAIASSAMLSGAIKGIGSTLLGVGALQIGFSLASGAIDELSKWYDKWFQVDAAVKQYAKDAADAERIKLFDGSGLQTQIEMVQDLDRQIAQLKDKQKHDTGFWSSFLLGPAFQYFSKDDAARLQELTTDHDKQQLKGIDLDYQRQVQRSESEQKVAVARAPENSKASIDEHYEELRAGYKQDNIFRRDRYEMGIYNRGREPKDQKVVPYNDGQQESDALKEQAQAEFQARTIDQSKATTAEIIRLNNEAVFASLQGVTLLEAQRKAADAEYVRLHGNSVAMVAAIDRKYYADEKRFLDEQDKQTRGIQRQAELAGLTGIAREQKEGDNRIVTLNEDKALTPANRSTQVAAVTQETIAKIDEQIQRFYDDVDRIADQSIEHQVSGFARIQAEAEKASRSLLKQFDDLHGNMDLSRPGAQQKFDQDSAKLGVGLNAINQGADKQTAQLAQKNADETRQIELEAQKRSMSVEKLQTLAIDAEYRERTQKYEQQLRSQEISSGDYNARMTSALKIRDAEMQAEAKAASDKLAGTLESFFKDPGGEAVKLAEQMMWRITSAWLLQLSTYNKQAHTLLMEGPDSFLQFALPKSMRTGHGGNAGVSGTAGANTSSSTNGAVASGVASGTSVVRGTFPGGLVKRGQTGSDGGAASGVTRPSYSGAGGDSSGGFTQGPILSSSNISVGNMAGANGATGGASLASATPATDSLGTKGSAVAPPASHTMQTVSSDIGSGISLSKSLVSDFAGKPKAGGASDGSSADTSWLTSLGGGGKDTAGQGNISDSNALQGGGTGIAGDGDKADQVAGQSGSQTAGDASTASKASSALGQASTAFSAGVGLWGAHESNGGFGGVLGGAASGAQMGSLLGPEGALIGAAAGAVIGFFGVGGTDKAKKYDKETVRPAIAQERASFEGGQTDYLTAYSDLESLDNAAKKATNQMGSGGQGYYQNTIKKEILGLESTLTRMSKAGRGRLSFTAAQYHGGGDIDNFGDLATSPTEGLIHAELGEFMVKPSAAAQNRSTLRQMQAGASIDSMVDSYRSTMQTNSARQSQRQADVTANLHFHSFDAKGARDMLMNNAPAVRAALNVSQSSYGGKSDA